MTNSDPHFSAESAVATREYVLRAMARNYAPGNSWDKIDAEACVQAADEIKRLTEQRDEARQLVVEANNSLYGSQGYFHSLNGGPFDRHHLSRGIEDLKAANRRMNGDAQRSELPVLDPSDEVYYEGYEQARSDLAQSAWMLIETAPRDEDLLLGWWREWPERKWEMASGLAGSTKGGWLHGQATHWQRLPGPTCASQPSPAATVEELRAFCRPLLGNVGSANDRAFERLIAKLFPPAATVEKSAPPHSASQLAERAPSSDAAPGGADTQCSAASEGARLSNWLADYSHDLKEEGDFDQEAAQLDKASQWIAGHLNVLPQTATVTAALSAAIDYIKLIAPAYHTLPQIEVRDRYLASLALTRPELGGDK